MTVEDEREEMVSGPSTSRQRDDVTPKLDHKHFDQKMCYAPPKWIEKKIELCRTLLPVLESPMSPPEHERGPSLDTLLIQSVEAGFHASYHFQNTRPYQKVSEVRYTGCMVCGRSVDAINEEKVDLYMQLYTPRNEPEQVMRLKKEAYENGLNAGSFLFLATAVSQAATCSSTTVTTTADGQEIMPRTLQTF